VLQHHRRSRFGGSAVAMIDTGCVDRRYRQVERAHTGQDCYKAAHGWSDSIGEIVGGGSMDNCLSSQVPVRLVTTKARVGRHGRFAPAQR
jgi:hypothetical protein